MRIHFIGICGVAMSALAIAFKKQGWQVTGSDAGFFPPVSTNLKRYGVEFYPGWHVEKMSARGNPDLIVVGNVASSANQEWLYAQEKKLNYKSYPEIIAEYFIRPNSIVCAGTYGKTTTAALLAWILTKAGYNPSYMFGGLAIDEGFDSATIARSPHCHSERSEAERPETQRVPLWGRAPLGRNPLINLNRMVRDPSTRPAKAGLGRDDNKYWSVLEGDEYKSSRWDNRPKFAHYSPTHLLLTDVQWDHADVYPTEELYFQAFEKLVGSIPKNGLIIVHERIADRGLRIADCAIYGASDKTDYKYFDIVASKNGTQFKINHKSTIYNLKSTMLGDYMAENITACFAMAREINIEPDTIIKAIAEFKGLKRRLEKRGQINDADVYDDIAHSPLKASHTLKILRQIYYNSKIFAVFEPNAGNRKPQSMANYENAFVDADEVIIPRLTKIKIDPNDKEKPLDGQRLAEVISQANRKVKYIEIDRELINHLQQKIQPNDAVVFLGSHGFRGMIDELICPRQSPQR